MDAANISSFAGNKRARMCTRCRCETSLKVLLQSIACLRGHAGGFVLLIEVNFLGNQFAGHVGKIDSPGTSRRSGNDTRLL